MHASRSTLLPDIAPCPLRQAPIFNLVVLPIPLREAVSSETASQENILR